MLMGTFTATANTSSTIGYARYGSSSWNTGTSSGACQGAWENTSASGSRVGVMVFSNAGTTLAGKTITGITLSITASGAGSGSSSKVLSFREAVYQYLNTNVNGSAQVGSSLGTLTGKFYENTSTHYLSASSNSAFFAALSAYLKSGNSALVIYNGEVSSGGSGSETYSTNYARITSITITVTYIEATVWYNNGGTWVQCYVYYNSGGSWIQCAPYYNSGGIWIQV